jgi:predicted kinase
LQHHLIHFICDSTGAGKTTYASQLTDRLKGVQFSIDEWMAALFWMDSPHPLIPAWSMERVERCMAQIWAVARQTAARNVPCVLDLGFSRTESRAKFAGIAQAAGLSVQLHFIDVPAEERWQRVATRNAQKGETYQLGFDVTREMFNFVEKLWEPPTDAEMLAYDGVRIKTEGTDER